MIPDLNQHLAAAQSQAQTQQVAQWFGQPTWVIAGTAPMLVDPGSATWLFGPSPLALSFTESGVRRVVFVGPGVVLGYDVRPGDQEPVES